MPLLEGDLTDSNILNFILKSLPTNPYVVILFTDDDVIKGIDPRDKSHILKDEIAYLVCFR